jgi:hypothetical protein
MRKHYEAPTMLAHGDTIVQTKSQVNGPAEAISKLPFAGGVGFNL